MRFKKRRVILSKLRDATAKVKHERFVIYSGNENTRRGNQSRRVQITAHFAGHRLGSRLKIINLKSNNLLCAKLAPEEKQAGETKAQQTEG